MLSSPLLSQRTASCISSPKGDARRIALVTGANRGIGLEVAKQLAINGMLPIIGSRNTDRGIAAVEQLQALGLDSLTVRLDVTCDVTIDRKSVV